MHYATLEKKIKLIPEQYLQEVMDFCDAILSRTAPVSTPSSELMETLQESEELLSNPNTKGFTSVQELFADLDRDD